MRMPSFEMVRVLKPRLGFGYTDVGADISMAGATVGMETEELAKNAEVVAEAVEATQLSLVRLADQLEMEMAPPQPVQEPETALLPEAEPQAPKNREGLLEGRRVGAIGFGRQDIAGLAAAMIEERGRIEFLPHGQVGGQGEFDLFFLNCGSLDLLKRELPKFQSVLESGTPVVLIGSRAALSVLRGVGDARTWDFAAKPLHMDELIWRAVNLLARCEEANIAPKLPGRVVVADHDPFTRTLIESALTSQGFTCELAEDGEAAWSAIGKSQPGAVILDLTLPNRDGFQLLADIRRAAGRKPKVIVLSARQSEADILRAFALGADDYVTKPFSPLELTSRLTRLVGGVPENA
jgi:CheY-like chemotaxis protein